MHLIIHTKRCEVCSDEVSNYTVPEGYICSSCYSEYIAGKLKEASIKDIRKYVDTHHKDNARFFDPKPLEKWSDKDYFDFVEQNIADEYFEVSYIG